MENILNVKISCLNAQWMKEELLGRLKVISYVNLLCFDIDCLLFQNLYEI